MEEEFVVFTEWHAFDLVDEDGFLSHFDEFEYLLVSKPKQVVLAGSRSGDPTRMIAAFAEKFPDEPLEGLMFVDGPVSIEKVIHGLSIVDGVDS